ncbi:2-amino-4-hydroxy-6-hydroxymethyldihydropteridine pyrophosphokinase [Oleiphilus sp. HI0125]|nr:2-amino-4-hydroxy-6-hydroxymethyldihydropteridine diphosphokinase [Oleiphilus sp. HI0125]KZZ57262.1 2-amino-4-hydroxy-6-hydroxymethyldihydropteridine pyrophosphokinase [Oleiphilus sp. HI0125]
MSQVYLSLGSNIEREKNIRSCLRCLERKFGELTVSPVYESEPVGFKGSNFFNLVVGITTTLTISELNDVLKEIEDQHGRSRAGPKFSSRTLDIDIITYNELVGIHDGVELPRPELFYNAFVLLPMIDLCADQLEPKSGLPYRQLIDQLPTRQNLEKVPF